MRISLDIPNPLIRHLKARAALEGSTLRDLVLTVLQRGLLCNATPSSSTLVADLPSIRLGAPMALGAADLSNAALSALVDA